MSSDISDDSVIEKSQEMDMTNHHSMISNGIKSIKTLYSLSVSEAKRHVESAYIERIQKIPLVLTSLQSSLSLLQSYSLSLPSQTQITCFSFNLLKCNHANGSSFIQIEGFKQLITLSLDSASITCNENYMKKTICKIFAGKNDEITRFPLGFFEKLGKIPIQQIIHCKVFSLFENFKNEEVDCCFYVNIELSVQDKHAILQSKMRDIQKSIHKLKADLRGTNILNEFKPTCCECAVI